MVISSTFRVRALLAALAGLALLPSPADARRATQSVIECNNLGCAEVPAVVQEKSRITRREKAKTRYAKRSKQRHSGGLVSIQCGRGTIRVASTAATQFEGFCRDLYATYKFKSVGGWRPGKCWTGGKHPCGGAIDIEQTCRSRGPGHCLPGAFPVARTEQLARAWGLKAGSEWGHRDVGHFETRSSLAGKGWTKGVTLASISPAEAAPKHWPVTLPMSPKMEQLSEQVAPTSLTYAAYNEYVDPRQEIVVLLSAMQHKPVGSAKEEIEQAADLFGLPRNMMLAFAKIESDFGCRVKTGSYKGLFQLSDYEFKRYGSGDIWNCRDNAIASAHKFVVEGINFQRQTGQPPKFLYRYMIHQQGAEGAAQHAAKPDRVAWRSMCATEEGKTKGEKWCRKAIWGNVPSNMKRTFKGGVEALTSGTFIEIWAARVNRFAATRLGAL